MSVVANPTCSWWSRVRRRGAEAVPEDRELVLYSRAYCHLCHDMEALVRSLLPEFGLTLRVVDVDADPELEARYNELVPVLERAGRELARWRADARELREALRR